MPKSDKETVRELRNLVTEQQEEIWHLKRALGYDLGMKLELGLTKTELRLFMVMVKHGSLLHERGWAILLSNNPNLKNPPVLFHQHIFNMRQKLAKHGIKIKTQARICYYLDEETLARVRPLILEDDNGLDKITKRSRTTDRPILHPDTAGGRTNGPAAH